MVVAKLLPRDYYSVDEDEMQPEYSFTEEITDGITSEVCSVDTIVNGIETSPSNINQLREYFTLLLLHITHHP